MNSAVQFHEESPPDVEGYLPFDTSSLLAIVLSGFSVGAFWIPAFALLGIPGLILGWRSSYLARRGKTASVCGVFGIVALLFGTFNSTAGLASHSFHRAHISTVAQERVEEWVNLLREGRPYEAYELHKQYQDRQIVGTNLEEYYKYDPTYGMPSEVPDDPDERMRLQMSMPSIPPFQEFDSFFKTEPLRTLNEHVSDGTLVYRGLQKLAYDGPDTKVVLRYSLIYRMGGGERETQVLFELMRSKYEGGEYQWMVNQILSPSRGE